MPSSNRRMNLAIPEDLYQKILTYKEANCMPTAASACIQLMRLQLRSIEQTEKAMEMFRKLSQEQIDQLTKEGLDFIKGMDKQ